MTYFKKELVSNKLRIPTGQIVPFETVGGDTGILQTEDEGLIDELRKAIRRRVGGVVEINEEQFEELKKNPPGRRSHIRSLDARSIAQLVRPNTRNGERKAVAPAEPKQPSEPSEPMNVPEGLVTISSLKKLRQRQSKSKTNEKPAQAGDASETK